MLASIVGPAPKARSPATAAELNADGKAALNRLYAKSDRARRYGRMPRDSRLSEDRQGWPRRWWQGGEGVLFVGGNQQAIIKSVLAPSVFRPAGSRSATRFS